MIIISDSLNKVVEFGNEPLTRLTICALYIISACDFCDFPFLFREQGIGNKIIIWKAQGVPQ